MTDEDQVKHLGVVDLLVFFGSLLSAMVIGLYYAVRDRKRESMDTYYFGGKEMSPIPVGLSIAVTFISAVTIIAYPAEVYSFGLVVGWFVFVSIIPTTFSCLFYVPLFMRLKFTSIFEIAYIAISIYAPSLALSAVTPLDLNVTIIVTSLVCTIYTAAGGIKAVVWTDTLQTGIMLAGSIAAIIKSLSVVGGFENVWDALDRGGRLNALNFDTDPTIRITFWTVIAGCAISWSSPHQSVVQRWRSCGTVTKARLSSIIAIFPTALFLFISCFNGATMFAYYENCDPVKSGKVEKPDQMMPYMVLDIFQSLPGMAGLFVAAAYSGSLSTVSSGINSVASLIIEDLVLKLRPKLTEKKKMIFSKALAFLLGLIATSFAVCLHYIDQTIIQITYSITGTLVGPITGVFVLGILFPWANTQGAVVGQVVGTAMTGWIAFGGYLYGKSASFVLDTSVEGCTAPSNTTYFPAPTSSVLSDVSFKPETTTTSASEESSSSLATTLYSISFLYYSAISLIVTTSSGLIASFITGANSASKADPDLFEPIISNPIFPKSVRKFFRFGVPYRDENFKSQDEITGEKLASQNLLRYNESKR